MAMIILILPFFTATGPALHTADIDILVPADRVVVLNISDPELAGPGSGEVPDPEVLTIDGPWSNMISTIPPGTYERQHQPLSTLSLGRETCQTCTKV